MYQLANCLPVLRINAVGIREVVYKLFLGSKSDYGGKMDQIGRVGKTRISTFIGYPLTST